MVSLHLNCAAEVANRLVQEILPLVSQFLGVVPGQIWPSLGPHLLALSALLRIIGFHWLYLLLGWGKRWPGWVLRPSYWGLTSLPGRRVTTWQAAGRKWPVAIFSSTCGKVWHSGWSHRHVNYIWHFFLQTRCIAPAVKPGCCVEWGEARVGQDACLQGVIVFGRLSWHRVVGSLRLPYEVGSQGSCPDTSHSPFPFGSQLKHGGVHLNVIPSSELDEKQVGHGLGLLVTLWFQGSDRLLILLFYPFM